MFSNSTKYAIRTILYLSEKGEETKSTVEEIATALTIPKPYLSKVLQQLSRSNVISSLKGRGGGFYMDKQNRKKNLIDVIVCIDGKNVFKQCLLGLPKCNDKNPCILHSEFKKFKTNLEKTVIDRSIEQMLKDNTRYK
ncbi:MAG: Rrf2 family transcriptional regulator [Cyclobacteriaceae bacterium]|nr:Rrf2 family transcriptional regulator [Cyclobacteriaceae bacterium]